MTRNRSQHCQPSAICNSQRALTHDHRIIDTFKTAVAAFIMLRLLCSARILKSNWSTCAGAFTTSRKCHVLNKPAAATKANITNTLTSTPIEWTRIYHLPLIRLVAAFNRLKIYQAALTVAGTPLTLALAEAGLVSTHVCSIYAALGVSGLVTLTLCSYLSSNLIGFMYINQQQDHLKLSHVDFWGRRKEAVIAIEDLLPIWEQEHKKLFNFYQPVYLRSNSQLQYKLLHRFGEITDKEVFVSLFGE